MKHVPETASEIAELLESLAMIIPLSVEITRVLIEHKKREHSELSDKEAFSQALDWYASGAGELSAVNDVLAPVLSLAGKDDEA